MRRISIEQLRTGDRIGRDVVSSPDAPPMLRAGIRVSDSYRQALQRYNITSVWIDDGLSDGIEPLEVLSENTKRRATTAIRDAFRDVSRSMSAGTTMPVDTVQEMTEVAELIVSEVAGNVHSALALNDLANADGYTMKHSLAVTALGLSLGLRAMRRYRLDRCPRRAALRRDRAAPVHPRYRAAAARHRQAGGAGRDSPETRTADR